MVSDIMRSDAMIFGNVLPTPRWVLLSNSAMGSIKFD
jgi:hypothetical protein